MSRVSLSIAALAVTAGTLDFVGVAGYRYGASVVTALLGLASAALTWTLTRRRWVAVAVAVLGVIAGGVLASRAPWSTGRLEAELDGLDHLDGFVVVETERAGHSWCRPDCPSVTRTWRAPDTSPKATVVVMTLALAEAGLAPSFDRLPPALADHAQVHGSETDALVTAERLAPGDLRVTVVLASHR